jgi:hypothetical protein
MTFVSEIKMERQPMKDAVPTIRANKNKIVEYNKETTIQCRLTTTEGTSIMLLYSIYIQPNNAPSLTKEQNGKLSTT